MFNECLIHLFDCTCLNVLYVCSTTCLIKLKRFLIILYILGSDFYHSLCSCFVFTVIFIVLSMFCVEKQVSEFLATRSGYSRKQRVLATRFADSPSHEIQSRVYTERFRDSLATQLMTRQSRNAQKEFFKELFMGNLF